jgi:hypothetical protein
LLCNFRYRLDSTAEEAVIVGVTQARTHKATPIKTATTLIH